jgi:hypothetical protein
VTAELIIRLEEQPQQHPFPSSSNPAHQPPDPPLPSVSIPEHRRVRPLEVSFQSPGKLKLTYTRAPYVFHETVTVPISLHTTPPVMPFRVWPLAEAVRLTGYQGLVRRKTEECRCKSYGVR